MTNKIHSSAIIEDGAILGGDIEIGPFCYVGGGVVLGDRVRLHSHVVVTGLTKVGKKTKIFPFASIGHEPQDMKYAGEETQLVIGNECIIREGVTLNPGTRRDKGITKIGNNCVLLANSHVAHDCLVGNNVILSNAAMIAGHCIIEDGVILGGGVGVHQFCRLGKNSFIGAFSGVANDVIPYGMALGFRAHLSGLNVVGMKRAGISNQSIHNAQRLFKQLFFSELTVQESSDNLDEEIRNDMVCTSILEFISKSGKRALCTPKKD